MMNTKLLLRGLVAASFVLPFAAQAADLCAGKTPGTFSFYNQEISRDAPLPTPVTQLAVGKPMFALACLTDKVGPQESGGNKFRVVLYVDGRQTGGVFRPKLSIARKDVIIAIDEDFSLDMVSDGTHEFRLQAASEKPTGVIDVSVDLKNDVAYIQQLRKAGYLADSKVQVSK